MPVIQVTLIAGYDDQTRSSLCKRLTDAARATIAAPIDGITVYINEVHSHSYMRGRTSRTPGNPLPTPEMVVRDYLAAMEARNMNLAQTYLADSFSMTFPGKQQFNTLDQLIEWAKTRYKSVSKKFDNIDVTGSDEGAVVYCSGELCGQWLDGSEVSSIRFIDRFVLVDGKIVKQEVWNDIGEITSNG